MKSFGKGRVQGLGFRVDEEFRQGEGSGFRV